jgi:hypothetical protein
MLREGQSVRKAVIKLMLYVENRAPLTAKKLERMLKDALCMMMGLVKHQDEVAGLLKPYHEHKLLTAQGLIEDLLTVLRPDDQEAAEDIDGQGDDKPQDDAQSELTEDDEPGDETD